MATRLLRPEIRTARTILRPWRPADRDALAELHSDREVMRHMPATLSREESDALVDAFEARWREGALAPWALEIAHTGELAGFVGLHRPTFEARFTPCVEIAWRLRREHWGHGYALEAATAALVEAFDGAGIGEVLAWTVEANARSWRLMERLGMRRDAEPFDHPRLPEGHPLRRHVLYRLTREALSPARP